MKKFAHFCFILIQVIFLASCSQKPAIEPPADLISEDTMVAMISEQLLVESVVFNASPELDKTKLARSLYSQLFEKYGISIPRYRTSLSYYFSDKERMVNMIDRAKVGLEAKRPDPSVN